MYLYLIRHGIAVDAPISDSVVSDELRSLSKVGRKKVAQVAIKLQKMELIFDLIITSPLVRARQTADILMEQQLSPQLEISDDLKPLGNLPAWLMTWNARSMDTAISNLALVGHEPSLSQWAELLLFGQVRDKLVLKKGGMIGLKFPDRHLEIGAAQLHCLIPPKYLN